jgi:hypothetical protein
MAIQRIGQIEPHPATPDEVYPLSDLHPVRSSWHVG